MQNLVAEAEAAAAEVAATEVRQQAEAAEAALEAELETLRMTESVVVEQVSSLQRARCVRDRWGKMSVLWDGAREIGAGTKALQRCLAAFVTTFERAVRLLWRITCAHLDTNL